MDEVGDALLGCCFDFFREVVDEAGVAVGVGDVACGDHVLREWDLSGCGEGGEEDGEVCRETADCNGAVLGGADVEVGNTDFKSVDCDVDLF
ncbi:MAG: hypothetical protein HONDAALG_01555 [Gammaproteobacteria bacterium]|nr:hypothetical protein [Gammaproteobacteria bacterium]